MNKKYFVYILSIVMLIFITIAIFGYNMLGSNKKDFVTKQANASSSTAPITSQLDWQAGSVNINTDLSEVGSVKISSMGSPELDLSGKTITAVPSTDQNNMTDNDPCNTFWTSSTDPGFTYWKIDLGEIMNVIPKFWFTTMCSAQYSTDDSTWTQISETGGITGCDPGLNTTNKLTASPMRYIRTSCTVSSEGGPYAPEFVYELKVYSPATATHTSGASQITNTDLYQWQTFSPTYAEPANTDISFKFRSSTDGVTWGSWTASQTVASGGSLDISSLVTSKTGEAGSETFYKYIQVETTLTSTDGVSTPTLSDYTIGYHTNVAPSTPTALTAVVGQ